MPIFEMDVPENGELEIADVAAALIFQGHFNANPVTVHRQMMEAQKQEQTQKEGRK